MQHTVKTIGYGVLFAFSPIILFLIGGLSDAVILDGIFSIPCYAGDPYPSIDQSDSVLCSIPNLLVLGGFMPALMIFTVPLSIVGTLGYIGYRFWKKPTSK